MKSWASTELTSSNSSSSWCSSSFSTTYTSKLLHFLIPMFWCTVLLLWIEGDFMLSSSTSSFQTRQSCLPKTIGLSLGSVSDFNSKQFCWLTCLPMKSCVPLLLWLKRNVLNFWIGLLRSTAESLMSNVIGIWRFEAELNLDDTLSRSNESWLNWSDSGSSLHDVRSFWFLTWFLTSKTLVLICEYFTLELSSWFYRTSPRLPRNCEGKSRLNGLGMRTLFWIHIESGFYTLFKRLGIEMILPWLSRL